MCGIFTTYNASSPWDLMEESFQKISYRGPDSSEHLHINNKLTMAFHRLAIMGISDSGNQPMKQMAHKYHIKGLSMWFHC